jgi:uncharacterized protein with FMN-binding domain
MYAAFTAVGGTKDDGRLRARHNIATIPEISTMQIRATESRSLDRCIATNAVRLRTMVLLAGSLQLMLGSDVAVAQMRTWTDKSGSYKTEAEFVDVVGGVVRLKKAGGELVSVPLARLSEADQAFLKQMTGSSVPSSDAADPLAPSDAMVTIEMLTGTQLKGRIVDRDETNLTIETQVGQYSSTRKIPLSRIRSVTSGSKRTTINDAPDAAKSPPGNPGADASPDKRPENRALTDAEQRTPAEINRLINELGRTTPDWWSSTPLNYPQTLDLTWPEKPGGEWNAQKNVGQYLWDIIKPNPSKWHEGTRFVHFLLEQHKNDRVKCVRDMKELGNLYFLLLRDFARAAFWWRQAGVDASTPGPEGIHLAECYWRLGSKPMAMDFLQRKKDVYFSTVKLVADMGETRLALQWAESAAKSGMADQAYLYAGDACRIEGDYDQAVRYYEKVLKIEPRGKEGEINRIKRSHTRAQANIEGIRIFDRLELKKIPDGTYRASAPGYGGDIQVEVVLRSGRIGSVKVIQHKEKQYYGAMIETPQKIIERQGVKGVDTTTSATITSEAIVNATAKALASSLK